MAALNYFVQNGDVDDSERDVYEYMLTRDEIQRGVTEVNSTVRAEIAEEKCKCMYQWYKTLYFGYIIMQKTHFYHVAGPECSDT